MKIVWAVLGTVLGGAAGYGLSVFVACTGGG